MNVKRNMNTRMVVNVITCRPASKCISYKDLEEISTGPGSMLHRICSASHHGGQDLISLLLLPMAMFVSTTVSPVAHLLPISLLVHGNVCNACSEGSCLTSWQEQLAASVLDPVSSRDPV